MNPQVETRVRAITGCLLGTAVGDALGLPAEGLTKARLSRMYPHLDEYKFLFGRGMVSDDTEHTVMVAQSLIVSAGDLDVFTKDLARRLKHWFLTLPAGMGMATAKACIKLLMGVSPDKSGVFSAGNGPAMRNALIGVCYGDKPELMHEFVRVSTRLTHTDPKAEYGAVAVALAAYAASLQAEENDKRQHFKEALVFHLAKEGGELLDLITKAVKSAEDGEATESFAEQIGWGRGVSGYVYSTVPIALHAWFRHPDDYRAAVTAVIRCGGDTDTAAAIVGGIVGASVGVDGIPQEWLDRLIEWPMSVEWMERLASQLADVAASGQVERPLTVSTLAVLPRNLFFLLVVLLHGFRRLLPPY